MVIMFAVNAAVSVVGASDYNSPVCCRALVFSCGMVFNVYGICCYPLAEPEKGSELVAVVALVVGIGSCSSCRVCRFC